jgi:signal peptidase I
MNSETIFTETDLTEVNSTFTEFIKFLRDFAIILMIVFFIRTFVITPFQINGQSMEPSYHDKEFILVDKISYLDFHEDYLDKSDGGILDSLSELWRSLPIHIGDPVRGDVVVIKPHVDKTREHYIKRVIGLPGDVIRFESGSVYLKVSGGENFVKLSEPYLSVSNSGHTYLPDYVEGNQFLVPAGTYWVMGDNRQNSADSRQCFQNCFGAKVEAHFIKRSNVIGKVLVDFGYFHIFTDSWGIDWKHIGWNPTPRLLSSPRNAAYPELGK